MKAHAYILLYVYSEVNDICQQFLLLLLLFQVIDLSGNTISSLRGLEGHSYLTEINMEDNQASNTAFICKLFTVHDFFAEIILKLISVETRSE